MQTQARRILWIDDEINHLATHISFLEQEGYRITTSTRGSDGLSLLDEEIYDAVLLSHMLPDMDGIRILSEIKKKYPHLPVVMITQSEQREIMHEAIIHRVDDFLMKPLSPKQIASELTFLLEYDTVKEDYTVQEYVVDFNKRRHLKHQEVVDWQTWIDIYAQLTEWDLRLDELDTADELREMHRLEKQESNAMFARYVEEHYCGWLTGNNSPALSVDVLYKYVIPEIQVGKQVFFVVLDCMRLDHWLTIKPLLHPYFQISTHYHYSILPTATNYSRNAIFSGLFPLEFAQRYPDLWVEIDDENTSVNRFEKDLMRLQLERHGILLKPLPQYFKIFDARGETEYLQWISNVKRISLAAVVVDFLDLLTHKRSEISLLKQLIPGETAFRTFVQGWFQHSGLYKILKLLADRGVTVVLTSDHGSILCQRAAKISGDRPATNGLRFKLGRQFICDEEASLKITQPERYMLPDSLSEKNYILAKEDYYFVYPNQFNDYKRQFHGGFQHGGISMEEMILPCAILEPKSVSLKRHVV
ncbi:MAG: bifunctional response regulator/alkaline phosphatase family protein [Candidatus Poribacteria bacterium]|nr:bifunctional response regulator/alkaline phosphatase family protein [Candidatus Poribacteria bacterium]